MIDQFETCENFSSYAKRVKLLRVMLKAAKLLADAECEEIKRWMELTHIRQFSSVRDAAQALADAGVKPIPFSPKIERQT